MDAHYPELITRSFPLNTEQLRQKVIEAFARLDWELVESGDTVLHAVVTTKLLKFKDDVYVSIDASSPDESLLQVRSVSRVGRGDLGTNIRHILNLYSAVDATEKN